MPVEKPPTPSLPSNDPPCVPIYPRVEKKHIRPYGPSSPLQPLALTTDLPYPDLARPLGVSLRSAPGGARCGIYIFSVDVLCLKLRVVLAASVALLKAVELELFLHLPEKPHLDRGLLRQYSMY